MNPQIDDDVLDQLAKSNPDLVAQYRAKVGAGNAGIQSARDTQDAGTIANVVGKNLTDLGNSRQKDAVLYNRFENMGGAPAIQRAVPQKYDSGVIDDVTGRGVQRAKDDAAQGQEQFWGAQKAVGLDRDRGQQDKERAQQQKGWDVENARNSPDSPQAQQAKLLLKNALIAKATEAKQGGAADAAAQLLEQAKTAGDGMGANDIMAQAKLIGDTSYDKVLQMKVAQSKIDANAALRQGMQEDKADRSAQAAAGKAGEKQNHEFTTTTQMLESARGNPAVAQAEKDLYAADKANSLATMYGDPNKLSSAQVQGLVAEIAKIQQGGAPSMHELDGLTPNTLASRFGSTISKLTNEPTPANAAAFVKQYQDYAKTLTKDAQKTIQDKYGRVIEARKGLHSDDQNEALRKEYLQRFESKEAKPQGMHGADLP